MSAEEIFNRLQKPGKKVAVPKPLKQVGKVGKQRRADRKMKLKAEPADYKGERVCYIGLERTADVVVEHVLDASVRPDLRSEPANQRWACADHNTRKKLGTLQPPEMANVKRAELEVLGIYGAAL